MRRTRLNQLGVSVALATLVLLFTQDFLLGLDPLNRLELSTIDYRFHLRGVLPMPKESLDVVIVEISQESFQALPHRWPWPRSYYARVLRNLKRAGALAVGFDLVFTEPDGYSPRNDEDFRKALRETGMGVLAGKTEIRSDMYTLKREQENYSTIFFDVDSSVGIVLIRNDADGVRRRYWPFAYDEAHDRSIPTFAFASLNKAYGQRPLYVAYDDPDEFLYATRRIPKFDDQSMLMNFYGPDGTFPHIKFADVIDDREFQTDDERRTGEEINTFDDQDYGYLHDGTFAGKVVLIGSRDPESQDLHPVPVAKGIQKGDNLMYGVEIHANVIQDVLDNRFLRKEPGWLVMLTIYVFCIGTFFADILVKGFRFHLQMLNYILGGIIAAAEIAAIFAISVLLFNDAGYVTVLAAPSLAVVLGFIGSSAYSYATERKQKVLIKGMFSQYVNPTVVDELVANPEKLRLGGERKELTVLFSDIAGFTTISESLSPENLVAILNEYLSEMTEIVFTHEGTLDKYEGDAIVAFWGAPIPQLDHALRACRAAIRMQESLKVLRKQWRVEGKPEIEVRVGLSTGEMVVGNMGGTRRFDYTVIGDTVNLGSRLESANKEYHTKIMMSEGTYRQVKDHVIARELDLLIVKGKTEPVGVFELIGFVNDNVSERYLEFLEHYSEALRQYKNRQWQSAMSLLQKALEIYPNDYPSFMYYKRAKTFEENPPPPNWNGVYILTTK